MLLLSQFAICGPDVSLQLIRIPCAGVDGCTAILQNLTDEKVERLLDGENQVVAAETLGLDIALKEKGEHWRCMAKCGGVGCWYGL